MVKYHLTNKAVEDLSDIWNYTVDVWSEKQADKYYAMLLDYCKELSAQPQRGKQYDIVRINLLGYKAGRHIIFYKIISDREIEVVRILHHKMDIKNRINN